MYTQCPDCEIAFRVTADVLKQAAGQVRCGGCGNAFNALAFLSEQMPKQPLAKAVNEPVPELTPEIIDTGGGLPKSISAEQSAALLKTLDELAGSDIRIEDTGVEWRVLDEDEAAAPAADDDDAGPHMNTSVRNVDEYLDDAETPIDEFLTATPEVVDAPEVFEDAANTPVVELRFDDDTPLPDDFDLGDAAPYAPAAELVPEEPAAKSPTDEPIEEPQPDLALSDPEEWTDILGEFQDLADEVAAPIDASKPLDMDTQFALQAEAMGIDLSGVNELDADEEDSAVESVDELVEDLEEELELALEASDDLADEQELVEEPIVESQNIEDELTGVEGRDEPAEQSYGDAESEEHFVPPMTEEEHTVNMQIDEDLMALAIEDKDGFASTIIIPGKDAAAMVRDEETAPLDDAAADDVDSHNGSSDEGASDAADDAELFETIIMEGDAVRSPADSKKLAADVAAAAKLADAARASDAEQMKKAGSMHYGMVAGVVLLVLLLTIQTIHQSREALATIPAFNSTVGQVYRAIGQPLQPAWDITGWRFEATKGSTEGDAEELTIYSRLGNNSDGPLPYPLIGISLTDRFEEIIGSRILDPVEYLPTDLDPRKLVEPGNTFNAVITIKSTSENATGFKLNVCYRLSNGQLRCAIDDFK